MQLVKLQLRKLFCGGNILKIYDSILDLIGGTPLLRLNNLGRGLPAEIILKLESFNPGGSSKDRIGLNMILQAEKKGWVGPGSVIIEPTSGNTGIGLALVCAVRGYRLILTMPENMSLERRLLLAAYGAEIILTPEDRGMAGAVEEAERLARAIPGSFLTRQFENPDNPGSHKITADEIWNDTGGKVDYIIAGVGTGGTITGVAKELKKLNPYIRIVAVEPASSAVLSGGAPGRHKLQGIGAGFIPKVLDISLVDEIVRVRDDDAVMTAQRLVREEGLMGGISSGAVAWAALEIAGQNSNSGKRIVGFLHDTGERYLSTELFKRGQANAKSNN